jgi:hypothetical protein
MPFGVLLFSLRFLFRKILKISPFFVSSKTERNWRTRHVYCVKKESSQGLKRKIAVSKESSSETTQAADTAVEECMKIYRSSVARLSLQLLLPAVLTLSIVGADRSVFAQDRPIKVARVSLIEGEVSSKRADDPNNDWSDAGLNLPLSENDQLYSGSDGRAEIQLGGRNLIRINSDTNLRFNKLSSDTLQLSLPIGVATFRIHSLDRRQLDLVDARDDKNGDAVYFEVDTPTVAVTILKEGLYRINVLESGATEVIVRSGQAEIYNQEIGTVVIKSGRRAVIEDQGYYQILKLQDKDGWDLWNESRDHELISRINGSQSARRLPGWIPGVYDLDGYGDWIETPDYGWVWSPRSVASGWGPYRSGYWRWNPYYGMTWISYEPWGWIPYHYGRWAYYRNRWCWTPYVNLSFGYDWGWRPHLVTFYGWGGGGYSGGYRDGYRDGYRNGRWDYIGWSPLGPRDGHGNRPVNVRTLDNYDAPGGRSIMDRGRFDNGRAVVNQQVVLNTPAPPRPGSRAAATPAAIIAAPVPLRTEDLKPTQAMPSRNPLANRAAVAQRIEAPVVARRPIVRTSGDVRDGQALPPVPSRAGAGPAPVPQRPTEPARTDLQSSPSTATGQPDRPARSPRAPEYRPVERIPAPIRRPPVVAQPVPSRENPSRETQHYPAPSRTERSPEPDMPSRSESPRPNVERQDRQHETRRPDPPRQAPPQRESAPSRAPERQSSPPPSAPQRESAPSRPASPPPSAPARESAPSRPATPERSTPDRPAGPRRNE